MTAIALPLIALVAVTAASLVLQHSERQERAVAMAASRQSSAANRVLIDALNAETGMRGYAVTQKPLFLAPYDLALRNIPGDLAVLHAAAAAEGDVRQERTVTAMVGARMVELARLHSAISHGATGGALTPVLEAGKAVMDRLRREIAALEAGPAAIVAARSSQINRMQSDIDTLTLAGLALGLLAGVLGVVLFTSGISRRVAASAANADLLGEGQPLDPVPSAGDEIGRLAASLVRAADLLDNRTAELTTARDEALRATKAKDRFLSSTSHELRTPLNAVLGFTQLLQLSDLNEEDRDGVERILAAGRHLLSLINELIDIARIESGEFSLSVEPVAVQPLLEEACQLMAPLAADRLITITQHCPYPALAAQADRQRLSQILVNLISNAIKYNRYEGTITITCQPRDTGEVTVVVADTGPGMSEADLRRIFVPFDRLGAEQSGIEGTGMGLPLAQAFAKAMKGELVASSVLGEGAALTLTLRRAADIAPAPRADAAPESAAAPAAPAAAGLRVLYIEDNPANVEVVSRFLRTRPAIRLQTAVTGQAGLELALREVPDLVLLDLHLPDVHGAEILKRLQAEPATSCVPVAVLSAEAAPAVIRNMRHSGVIAYLTKPLDLAELGQLIDSFLISHGLLAGRGQQPPATPRKTLAR